MSPATPEDFDKIGKKPPSGRKLLALPGHGEPPSEWREWLDHALPMDGHRIYSFMRHGRQRSDACELVVADHDGRRHHYEIAEQRNLSTPAALRATLVSETDGLVCPRGGLTKPELEDIWVALVTLATVTAQQSTQDETRGWLEETIQQSAPMVGYSMVPARRQDALDALLRCVGFDFAAARAFLDPATIDPVRPVLVVDEETDERWMRVGEVAAFWRHVLQVGVMSQPTIDGRLSAIGVKRHEHAFRPSVGSPRKIRLYRVADGEEPK